MSRFKVESDIVTGKYYSYDTSSVDNINYILKKYQYNDLKTTQTVVNELNLKEKEIVRSLYRASNKRFKD